MVACVCNGLFMSNRATAITHRFRYFWFNHCGLGDGYDGQTQKVTLNRNCTVDYHVRIRVVYPSRTHGYLPMGIPKNMGIYPYPNTHQSTFWVYTHTQIPTGFMGWVLFDLGLNLPPFLASLEFKTLYPFTINTSFLQFLRRKLKIESFTPFERKYLYPRGCKSGQ